MTFFRISKIGVLMLGVALTGASLPAQAGFEFAGSSVPPQAKAVAPEDALDAPMPIVPMADVTSVPLDAPPSAKPDVDHVLKVPVSRQAPPVQQAEPVYIRRQRGITMAAPKNQPMDMEALLKATENMEPVSLPEAPRRNLVKAPAVVDDGKLVINPYPLESATGATHGGGLGRLATEQALLEQSGALRPVIVPGRATSGMIARADISSRYDKGAQYLDRTPAADDAEVFGLSSSMTPLPGGELAPLPPSQQQLQAQPLPPVAAMPRPATPEGYPAPVAAATAAGGFAEAVGFGRELPLALALSQVVPPEYSYAFGTDVNVGSTVSWQGGKPWNQVLEEMLATQGLRAVISGTQVTIVNA